MHLSFGCSRVWTGLQRRSPTPDRQGTTMRGVLRFVVCLAMQQLVPLTTSLTLGLGRRRAGYLDRIRQQPTDMEFRSNNRKPRSGDEKMGMGFARPPAVSLNGRDPAELKKFAYNMEYLWTTVLKHAQWHTELVADVLAVRTGKLRSIPGVSDKLLQVLLRSVDAHAKRLFDVDFQAGGAAATNGPTLAGNVEKMAQVLGERDGGGGPFLKLRPGLKLDGQLQKATAYTYNYMDEGHNLAKPDEGGGPYSVWVMEKLQQDYKVSGALYDKKVWNAGRESQVLVLIHESSHVALSTQDWEYADGFGKQRRLEKGTRMWIEKKQLGNADSYAYFIESVVWDLIREGDESDPEFRNREDFFHCYTTEQGRFLFDRPNKTYEDESDRNADQANVGRLVREYLNPKVCTGGHPRDIKSMDFPAIPGPLQPREMRRAGVQYPFDYHVQDAIILLRLQLMKWNHREDAEADPCAGVAESFDFEFPA
ncbi:unnamed protein product [Amoebophrya sp. A120]|nr:unnamed protein product [Amoebophrya sp. A120]|eukprot:GSA120T00003489001.1